MCTTLGLLSRVWWYLVPLHTCILGRHVLASVTIIMLADPLDLRQLVLLRIVLSRLWGSPLAQEERR